MENVDNKMKNKRKYSPRTEYVEVNSLKLIRLVRSNEILFKTDNSLCCNKSYREEVWEGVYAAMFPEYYSMDEKMKELMGLSVRRRWKSLRDSLACEVKKSATVENYVRKKKSPIIAELEFLIPHIKSSHCVRFAEQLGLSNNINNSCETEVHEVDESTTSSKGQAIERDIKMDESNGRMGNGVDESGNTFLADACKPVLQMNESDGLLKEKAIKDLHQFHNAVSSNINAIISQPMVCTNLASLNQSDVNGWNNQFYAISMYKGDEFINFGVQCLNSINEEENINDKVTVQQNKRLHLENEESTDLPIS
ncbi:uncharacterized protein LOC119687067 [Teleopsis dalmanni]|uniref:uncharacterized protein LOC119687067 n=1 Tax=Teleopsis dalmanni TaxID=139649 RepID=UPI000D32A9AD|nr:uncharacterized protein LOC119687067 [Teleopsis dalmanni]